MEYPDKWEQIVQLQQYTKELILLAEEYEFEWRTFLQPVLEQRSALDHVCRAASLQINDGSKQKPDLKRAKINLDKAVGHLYRAFFDTADWISAILREKIISELQGYDTDTIGKVIPDYYQKIRPDIEQISQEISRLRNQKDISSSRTIIQEVNEYNDKIHDLLNHYMNIITKKGFLEEFKRRKALSFLSKSPIIIFIAFIIGFIVALVTVVLTLMLK